MLQEYHIYVCHGTRKTFPEICFTSSDIPSSATNCCRRISYQETSQTFGVISLRMDVQDSNGRASPARVSASTQAQNISSSSSTAKMLPNPSSALIEPIFGDEVEVHSLLVLDQHTFEGVSCNCYDNLHCVWMISRH